MNHKYLWVSNWNSLIEAIPVTNFNVCLGLKDLNTPFTCAVWYGFAQLEYTLRNNSRNNIQSPVLVSSCNLHVEFEERKIFLKIIILVFEDTQTRNSLVGIVLTQAVSIFCNLGENQYL